MKQFFFSFACLTLLASCGSSDNKPDSAGESTNAAKSESAASGSNVITFKANGETVKTAGLTISRTELMPGKPLYLNFTSDMHQEKRTVNINVNNTLPSTYALGGTITGSHGLYFPDYGAANNAYTFTNGTVVLTEVDTVKNIVNGTFSGDAQNEAGEKIAITDGKIINGTLTPGILRMPE